MKKLLFVVYSLFLISFVIFSFLFIDHNLFYLHNMYSGFAFHKREITTGIYIVFVSLFFLFYFCFMFLLKRQILRKADFKKIIGLTVGILFFSYPAMLSYDIFNYIATSKVLFFYHENPYIVMPIEFAGDPLLAFTHAANKIALYGPVWIILTGIPYLLSFENFLITLLSFKLFVYLFYAASIILISKITKNMFSTLLFALNPLVVVEILISGHNDIVMMFFALLSLFLLSKNKIGLAVLFLSFSIFIKYATVFLLPIFAYTVFKTIKKQHINWKKIYFWAYFSMMVIFLLSFLREEIYPWYGIWFLAFSFLDLKRKFVIYASLAFSLGLLLRYVPFMLSGSYFGLTPIIKTLATFIPVILVSLAIFIKEELWLKIFSR